MLKIDLKKVLENFGKTLDLELAFDADGLCVLTLDEETPIAIQAMEEDSSLTLSCAFKEELPRPMSLAKVEDLLALALDPMERGGASPVVGREAESGSGRRYFGFQESGLSRSGSGRKHLKMRKKIVLPTSDTSFFF